MVDIITAEVEAPRGPVALESLAQTYGQWLAGGEKIQHSPLGVSAAIAAFADMAGRAGLTLITQPPVFLSLDHSSVVCLAAQEFPQGPAAVLILGSRHERTLHVQVTHRAIREAAWPEGLLLVTSAAPADAVTRVVVIGSPRAGKTTYADARGQLEGVDVRHTDDLIGQLDWSAVSEHVATEWFAAPGPWIVEGVAAVRALRKWLRYHAEGKPCEEVVVLEVPWVELSKGQASMAKGCSKVWAEVEGEIEARGVLVSRPAQLVEREP